MMPDKMTPMERLMTTMSHKEPDRVPLFLLLSMHGARELGMSIKQYFSKAENVVEGQKILQKKYSNDCFNPFFYASVEAEAFGAEVIYSDDGPPNTGRPVLKSFHDIDRLSPPDIRNAKVLHKVLKAIELLNAEAHGTIPIIGVVMSPFSLPVMQLGFDKYFDLMFTDQQRFERLMKINEAFCIDWANAQLTAGATAICYFDPVSSTTIVTREQYIKTGYRIAQRTLSAIKGPTATHMASGICIPIADKIIETGTAAIGVSAIEDIGELKEIFKNKVSIIGNLNGITMRNWTQKETINMVRSIIQKVGQGGGFILSDNHGEIPFQVPEFILSTITEAVKNYGTYPLKPIKSD
jgi:uroporphyrinogen decarboxylase